MAITLTERAICELKDLMVSEGKASAALRVWVAGGGCSGLNYGMALDENAAEQDDEEFTQDGLRVLVDKLSLQYLQGASVDFVDDNGMGGFKIDNPNASSTCGCGNSFQAEGAEAPDCGSCGCAG